MKDVTITLTTVYDEESYESWEFIYSNEHADVSISQIKESINYAKIELDEGYSADDIMDYVVNELGGFYSNVRKLDVDIEMLI